jgi:IS30 family transposase
MSHQHLNIEQRNRLYQLCQEGNLSQRQIAVLLGCHQSTTRARIKKKSKFPRMLSSRYGTSEERDSEKKLEAPLREYNRVGGGVREKRIERLS